MSRKIEKPWGYELIWAVTDRYVGKILSIQKGEGLSYQYHREKEESIFVADGILNFEYEENGVRQSRRLLAGESVHIPPRLPHRLVAVEECRIFEVSTPHPDDIVRIEDRYGRAASKG